MKTAFSLWFAQIVMTLGIILWLWFFSSSLLPSWGDKSSICHRDIQHRHDLHRQHREVSLFGWRNRFDVPYGKRFSLPLLFALGLNWNTEGFNTAIWKQFFKALFQVLPARRFEEDLVRILLRGNENDRTYSLWFIFHIGDSGAGGARKDWKTAGKGKNRLGVLFEKVRSNYLDIELVFALFHFK